MHPPLHRTQSMWTGTLPAFSILPQSASRYRVSTDRGLQALRKWGAAVEPSFPRA